MADTADAAQASTNCPVAPTPRLRALIGEAEKTVVKPYLYNGRSMITTCQRKRIVEHVYAVCDDFGLDSDCFHYAMNYLDRLLSKKNECHISKHLKKEEAWNRRREFLRYVLSHLPIDEDSATKVRSFIGRRVVTADENRERREGIRKEISVLSCVAVLIAAKFSSLKVPRIADLIEGSGSECTVFDMQEAEVRVLCTLEWQLRAFTPHDFVALLLKSCGKVFYTVDSREFRMKMNHFLDCSCWHHSLLAVNPCTMAAASMVCAWGCTPDVRNETHSFDQVRLTFERACGETNDVFSSCVFKLFKHVSKVCDYYERDSAH